MNLGPGQLLQPLKFKKKKKKWREKGGGKQKRKGD